jgi:hypothetical protein
VSRDEEIKGVAVIHETFVPSCFVGTKLTMTDEEEKDDGDDDPDVSLCEC